MSYDVLPPKTQPEDRAHPQSPEQTSFLEGPPAAGFAPSPSSAKPDPEAAALVLGHYADDAEDSEPAPGKHGHGQHGHGKHGHGHKHHGGHHEAKAGDKAKEAAHPEIFHTGLGDKIDQMAAKSPTLERELQTLQKRGWSIGYGQKGKGTFASRTKKGITVDPNEKGNPLELLQSLAHESGHAMYTPGPQVPMDGLTRQQYIDRNVDPELKDEGEAAINNMQVRQELLKAKQGDIGVAGAQSKKYLELYKKYPDAKDRDKLREEIGKVFAHGEHPSTAPKLNYEQYYAKSFAESWDTAHPPAHK